MKKKNIIYFTVIITIVFIAVFLLNHYTVFTSDDFSFLYDYKGVLYTEGISKITSLSQVIESMKNLYLNVNGRIVPHLLLQVILIFPKFVFNVLNSFIFVLLGILIYKISIKEKIKDNFKPFILIMIYTFIFILTPSFGMTVLWCSGAFNYMWTVCFILLYFVYFNKVSNKKEIRIVDYILLFLLSFICSNSVESFSVSVLIFNLYQVIYLSIKNKKVLLWTIIPLIASLIGVFILFTAASGNRAVGTDFINMKYILDRTISLIELLSKNIVYLIVLVFCLIIYILYENKKNGKNDFNILIYYLTGVFSLAPLYAVSYIEPRMFMFIYMLLIIGIIYVINNLIEKDIIKISLSCVFLAIGLYTYIFIAYKDVKLSYDIYIDKVENVILENKENNNMNVIIEDYQQEYSKYTAFNNKYTFLGKDRDGWMNKWIAFYYGVDSVEVE